MIDTQHVQCAAELIDLPIAPEHLDAVVANLQRMAQIAAPLFAVPLAPEDEAGPIWRP